MPKIAMLGAGSLIFCKTLINDFLATSALNASEICLMSITRPKLDKMEAFVRRMIAENKLQARVWSTLDRREALKDADYVIIMIQVGGIEAFRKDYEIPMKYGVDQCVADSLGPGGVFRGMRTIPVLIDIVREMEELCPRALLLNYANPMAANCMALGRAASKIQFIGLCHGVQTTLDLISRYVDVPKDQIDYLCAGINHMGWFLTLRDRRDGRDLYPILRSNCEKPEYYTTEKVRCEVMRHFGYFMTESTGHLSEYVPWFRSHERSLKRYCDQPSFGGETGAYYQYCDMIAKKYEKTDYLTLESPKVGRRSVEYCSYILEAAETGAPFRLNGNVRNDGYICNLPAGCCVEVPVYVDRLGLHPLHVGALPPQCAALNQSNISVQSLAVEAAFTGDPEYAVQAIAMDPLTSAVCTLDEVREMTIEMLEAQRQWLPRFAGKSIAPKPIISIPADVVPVDVPLDPALAIAHRFGKLATQEVKPG
ncbi:MAG TPA: alpha-galactosidase [Candidatus Paceibacterota bacterium]|nr:alpha-galactosidase [Verrucomicrobiota bacterium]HRY48771.1 alpha-galactosidase [Candidatus Paceibacterota bacterium]HSA00900.1 alpha-galactosidase [Candidatus Paceibacterota bacterium]